MTQVLSGEPILVEAVEGDWARIRTAYDYPGWIQSSALAGEPDAHWLERRVTSPVDYARTLRGTPYLWGGMTSAGIDCSGLVHMSYRAAGRLVPRDAAQQEESGLPVEEPQAGDLITYGEPETHADHVAFWVGEGRILHSTQRDGIDGVVEEPEPAELQARRRRVIRL